MKMSRTHHPSKHNFDSHPYWIHRWWCLHEPARDRRIYNRIARARDRNALRQGLRDDDLVQDPPPRRRFVGW